MNKIIPGGILVTMMGGVPGATYLLTRESTPEDSEKQINPAPVNVPSETDSVTCTTTEDRSTCSNNQG